MVRYIIKRLLLFIPTLLGISVIVFLLLHLMPGDPATVLLGQDATPEDIARLRNILGLNQPLYVQLIVFLENIIKGNLGVSIFQNQNVSYLIGQHLPATLELAVAATVISLIIAVPLGIISAVKQFSWLDYVSMFFSQIGVSMPVFWLGMLLVIQFSVSMNWLPSFGRGIPFSEALVKLITTGNLYYLVDSLRHLLLPALTLGLTSAALVTRMIRSAMLEVLKEEYIRTAEAKGVRGFVVVMKHAFRNALLPVITIVGIQFGALLGGAIATETIFAWPGVGQLIVTAIGQRDFPVVQGCVLVVAALFALVNLFVDVLYAVVNPKIRHQ